MNSYSINSSIHNRVQEMARQGDSDRYACSLFCPRKHRAAIWTLLSFNYEIARTPEVVSEPMMGRIRLQWWRDALHEIYEGQEPRRHEVVFPLANIIKRYNLPNERFIQLIEAREDMLENPADVDINEMEKRVYATNLPLNQLISTVLTGREKADEGTATRYGFQGMLRLKLHKGKIDAGVLNQLKEKMAGFNKKPETRFDKAMLALTKFYDNRIAEFQNSGQAYTLQPDLSVRIFQIWWRLIFS